MAIPVLIATPTAGFRDLLRETLEETNRFTVQLVGSGAEALASFKQNPCKMAMIDCDLRDLSAEALIRQLRSLEPDLPVIAIQSGLESCKPFPPELVIQAILPKPFYLPDMMDTILRVLGIEPEKPPTVTLPDAPLLPRPAMDESELPWLLDVDRAAQYLTRFSLSSSAQAALLTRAGELWAYAGQLSRRAALELADQVGRHWNHAGESDLARFVRLESSNSEFILYATRLGTNMVLALVFDATMPFSKIRNQAGQLARALASPSGGEAQLHPAQRQFPATMASQEYPPAQPKIGKDPTEEQLDFLDSLLNNLIVRESRAALLRAAQETIAAETEPVSQVESPNGDSAAKPITSTDLPSETEFAIRPVAPTLYHLFYACLLVPRLPDHLLVGPLAVMLNHWMRQLCLAFDWQLAAIAIRPFFLEWIANPGPVASPEELVRQIRQQTSRRIFAAFPAMAEQNPSGDFWAPGSLIVGTTHPLPAQLINDFIAETRRRQGLPGER
jgi:CheY-like chemotaxis protein/REP element-mobilizing transposase RayT